MRLYGDLLDTAASLGLRDALGSYPRERRVLEACLRERRRPVEPTARLLGALADAYDEAREEALKTLAVEA